MAPLGTASSFPTTPSPSPVAWCPFPIPRSLNFYSRYAWRPASPHPPSTPPSRWRQGARDERRTLRCMHSGQLPGAGAREMSESLPLPLATTTARHLIVSKFSDLETPLTSLASTRLFAVPASLLPARSFSDQGNSVGSFSDFRIFAYILRCVTIYWRGCRRASLRRGPQPSGPV